MYCHVKHLKFDIYSDNTLLSSTFQILEAMMIEFSMEEDLISVDLCFTHAMVEQLGPMLLQVNTATSFIVWMARASLRSYCMYVVLTKLVGSFSDWNRERLRKKTRFMTSNS
ncbi:uncharacterized protein LOC110033453 [Phalaenopsis equestris]|uniref:uncharacterized protein LOC110033453 n=1 Tax=Phalaenopsis equestris TaxID=78828 RepID=UPI0009E44FCF|nr:uncharacterized protein LOC110033453 [Phalaenopsis equestris]